MTEHPMIFSGDAPLAILDSRKTQTRRVVVQSNSLFDGSRGRARQWPKLDWNNAYVDPGPSPAGNPGPYLKVPYPVEPEMTTHRIYPRWQRGDVLWVRESYNPQCGQTGDGRPAGRYLADGEWLYGGPADSHPGTYLARGRSVPSRYMPKWACRLRLEVLNVRVERVQDIGEEDATAEGCVADDLALHTWWQGYDSRLRDRWGNLNHAQVPGETPPDWLLEPKKMLVGSALEFTAKDYFRLLWDTLNAKPGYGWDVNPWVWAIEFKRTKDAKDGDGIQE